MLRGFCKEVYVDVDIIIYYTVPPSSPCSPIVSRSGPCALNVLPLYTALQLRNCPKWPERSAARAAVRAVQVARYLLTCAVSLCGTVVCGTMLIPLYSFYIALSPHPYTHPLHSYLHMYVFVRLGVRTPAPIVLVYRALSAQISADTYNIIPPPVHTPRMYLARCVPCALCVLPLHTVL